MLSWSFGSVYWTYIIWNPWIVFLFSIFVCWLFCILHAVLCIRFKTNQSVSGIGINVFVSGLTIVLTRAVWKSDGMSGQVEKLPSVSIPGLKELPVIGTLFTEQSPYLFITAGIVLGAWFFMYRTKAGLRLRAIGDHPQAAQTVGINVSLYRYVAVTFCGMLCGLAGGYLSIVQATYL